MYALSQAPKPSPRAINQPVVSNVIEAASRFRQQPVSQHTHVENTVKPVEVVSFDLGGTEEVRSRELAASNYYFTHLSSVELNDICELARKLRGQPTGVKENKRAFILGHFDIKPAGENRISNDVENRLRSYVELGSKCSKQVAERNKIISFLSEFNLSNDQILKIGLNKEKLNRVYQSFSQVAGKGSKSDMVAQCLGIENPVNNVMENLVTNARIGSNNSVQIDSDSISSSMSEALYLRAINGGFNDIQGFARNLLSALDLEDGSTTHTAISTYLSNQRTVGQAKLRVEEYRRAILEFNGIEKATDTSGYIELKIKQSDTFINHYNTLLTRLTRSLQKNQVSLAAIESTQPKNEADCASREQEIAGINGNIITLESLKQNLEKQINSLLTQTDITKRLAPQDIDYQTVEDIVKSQLPTSNLNIEANDQIANWSERVGAMRSTTSSINSQISGLKAKIVIKKYVENPEMTLNNAKQTILELRAKIRRENIEQKNVLKNLSTAKVIRDFYTRLLGNISLSSGAQQITQSEIINLLTTELIKETYIIDSLSQNENEQLWNLIWTAVSC